MGCCDNNARRFARLTKHYYSRRYGEKDVIFSKRQSSIQSEVYAPLNPAMGAKSSSERVQVGALAEIEHFKYCHNDT